jgi:hypothetical protein
MGIVQMLSRLAAPLRMPVDVVLRSEDRGFIGGVGMDVEKPALPS